MKVCIKVVVIFIFAMGLLNGAQAKKDNRNVIATGGGWITDQFGAKGTFGFNVHLAKGGFKGHLEYNVGGSIVIHSTEINFVNYCGVNCVAVAGTCVFNGEDLYWFEIEVIDNGEPGKESDEFRILIRSGEKVVYDSGGLTTLGGGNIQVWPPTFLPPPE